MKRLRAAWAFLAVSLAVPAVATAAEITSVQLIEEPSVWDGRVVTITGEAIGESMARGDEVWLHLNDDAYAESSVADGAALQGYNSGIAVVVDTDDAAAVTVFGDYRHQGDLIQVTGTFNAACAEHGGDMDLHADGVTVLDQGRVLQHAPDTASVIVLALSGIAAAVAIGAFAYQRSRD